MKRTRALLFLSILVVCIGCDQTSKRIAGSALEASPISFAGELVRFELAHNSGGFLSIGSGLSSDLRGLIFLMLVPLALAAVCLGALRSGFTSGGSMVGLGMMVGGGLGNWLDRLTNGGSRDRLRPAGARPPPDRHLQSRGRLHHCGCRRSSSRPARTQQISCRLTVWSWTSATRSRS